MSEKEGINLPATIGAILGFTLAIVLFSLIARAGFEPPPAGLVACVWICLAAGGGHLGNELHKSLRRARKKRTESAEAEALPQPPPAAPVDLQNLVLEFNSLTTVGDLGPFLVSHSAKDLEAFLLAYPVAELHFDSVSIDTRFESLLFLARMLLRYNDYKANPQWRNALPPSLPASRLADRLVKRITDFLHGKEEPFCPAVVKTFVYDYAMDLINADRNRAAMVALRASRPGCKKDHDYWLCICCLKVAKLSLDLAAIDYGLRLVVELEKPESGTSEWLRERLACTKMLQTMQKLKAELTASNGIE